MTNEDILNAVEAKTVGEIVELIEAMEEKFGVTAAVAVAAPSGDGDGGDAAAAKDDFDVVLKGDGGKKVAVIKAVRTITGLGLKEAKTAVESVPTVLKEGVPKAEAEEILKQLEEVGADAELK